MNKIDLYCPNTFRGSNNNLPVQRPIEWPSYMGRIEKVSSNKYQPTQNIDMSKLLKYAKILLNRLLKK